MKKSISGYEATACRWVARFFGGLLVMVSAYIAICQGLPNIVTQPLRVQVEFLGLALILAGIVAGWRREFAGGIISLLGWSLFLVTMINSARALTGFVIALAVPGLFYVISALLRRSHEIPIGERIASTDGAKRRER